jgi:uncharacterized protein YndB with AHSA1/START domain
MRFLDQNSQPVRKENNMDASDKKGTNPSFEIKRIFTAPLDRVWKAWSERDQFAKWWGPMGCSVEVSLLEFRPGGFCHTTL